MKYNSTNKPLICMQTQSTCYRNTRRMTPKGVLWHSTGADNPWLKRYVQPSEKKPAEDTYTKEDWLKILGKNTYDNDWNHGEVQAGLNGWIGKLADGTVATIQTMPWDYRPWGCGKGAKGTCNDGFMQFEICEDSLNDKVYFEQAYREACELTAYYCQMFNIDPKGTTKLNGVTVPNILCHADSYDLGLGSNHDDIYNWFKKYGKTMDDVRNDVAKLLTASEIVKEYDVVAEIPVYVTAADAKAKTNAKGIYEKGTYYIYNKYPDGIDGMLNISKDKTGSTAGAWINPIENILTEAETEVQKLYRVRTSWDDAKSQKGAFNSLENAIICCQEAGEGYKVFDWNGIEVYTYTAPEASEQPADEESKEPTIIPPKAVYDLDYPQKSLIIDPEIPDELNKESCTKAIVAITKNNADFDCEIAKTFFKLAGKYRIDPMRAISQSVLETGWFKFVNSSVKPEQHNYCGLGATGGGVSGASFDTIEDGVRAQLQHLYAYGCDESLPENEQLVDPRYKYVTRGIAPYWEQLAGRWAVPGYTGDSAEAALAAGTTYGQKIAKIYRGITETDVSNEDISKYFDIYESGTSEDLPAIDPNDNISTEQETVDTSKAKAILDLLWQLIKLLINFFSKK